MPMAGTGGLDCSVNGSAELGEGAAGAAVAACWRNALDAPPLKPASDVCNFVPAPQLTRYDGSRVL